MVNGFLLLLRTLRVWNKGDRQMADGGREGEVVREGGRGGEGKRAEGRKGEVVRW